MTKARREFVHPMETGVPSVGAPVATVVIPCRNERDTIAACLDSVQRQTEKRLQILVVDGMSTDGTRELLAWISSGDPRVHVLDNESRGIPYALNIGLAAAHALWLVRVDAHSTVPEDYVEHAVGLLSSGRWGGVGGRKVAVADTVRGRAIARALGSRLGVGDSSYHYAVEAASVDHVPFGAYPVYMLRNLGGWDEDMFAGEDVDLDRRVREAGEDLLLEPRLRVDWRCRDTAHGLFQQYRRYGRGRTLAGAKARGNLRPRHAVPAAFVAYLVAVAVLLIVQPLLALTLAVPYVGALLVGTATAGSGLAWRERAYLPAAFAAMHTGWGIGFWEGVAGLWFGRAVTPANDRLSAHDVIHVWR